MQCNNFYLWSELLAVTAAAWFSLLVLWMLVSYTDNSMYSECYTSTKLGLFYLGRSFALLFYIKLLIRYRKLSHPGCSLEVLLPPRTTFNHFTPLRRLEGLGECSCQVTGGKPPQSRKGFQAHPPALPDMTLPHFYSLKCRVCQR